MANVTEHKYLIIGGTTKAATTSLFYYLGDHPDVCIANDKEVRFFLPKDDCLPGIYRLEDGLEKYERFFNHCGDGKLRVEASADYLYSKEASFRIKETLPNSKIVFILREPNSRVVSWYKYSRQFNLIPEKMTFDEYVKMQYRGGKVGVEQHLLAMVQGRYSDYLKHYYEVFSRDRVYVVFYEDLARTPSVVLQGISEFVGIDHNFYANYEFKVYNRSMDLRNPALHRLYAETRLRIRRHTHDKPAVQRVLSRARLMFEPIYLFLNSRGTKNIEISESSRQILNDYYRDEKVALEELTGRTAPWEDM